MNVINLTCPLNDRSSQLCHPQSMLTPNFALCEPVTYDTLAPIDCWSFKVLPYPSRVFARKKVPVPMSSTPRMSLPASPSRVPVNRESLKCQVYLASNSKRLVAGSVHLPCATVDHGTSDSQAPSYEIVEVASSPSCAHW